MEDPSGAVPPCVSGFSMTAGADGRFRIPDLPAVRVALQVYAKDCLKWSQEVALDREDLVVRLAAAAPTPVPPPPPVVVPVVPVTAASGAARLGGRLLDLAGNSKAQERVELAAASATVAAGPWRIDTDAHGAFAFADLPAGTFDVRWIRREGGLEVLDLETRLTLAEGERRELELGPSGRATLTGSIELNAMPPPGSKTTTLGYGTPPAPLSEMPALVVVQLLRSGGEEFQEPLPSGRRGCFARDGRFSFEGVEGGEWSVEVELVSGDTHVMLGGEVHVPVEGTAEIALKLYGP
ncbi:MAG: hypothetical protein EXS08_06485 [Planctomycetes bacterium]|nr:hypothetical protein [Planctomycetota bacterium]